MALNIVSDMSWVTHNFMSIVSLHTGIPYQNILDCVNLANILMDVCRVQSDLYIMLTHFTRWGYFLLILLWYFSLLIGFQHILVPQRQLHVEKALFIYAPYVL